jgi:hypothetical protein
MGNGSVSQLNATMQNISESLTRYIRQNSEANWSKSVEGITWHNVTCVKIRWPWLAFPASLSLITLLLFLWTVIDVTRAKAPLWKSSPLATIFRGPTTGIEEKSAADSTRSKEAGDPDSVNYMEDLAKKLIVKLDRSGDVVRLESE